MLAFIVRRILHTIPVVIIMSFVVFVVTSLLPGDAAYSIGGEDATPEQIEAIREQLGLNDPIPLRYLDWVAGIFRGDLGNSLITGRTVVDQLAIAIPVTLELAVLAIIFAVLIGIPLGVLTATRRNGWVDNTVGSVALIGVSLPWLWLGLLLVTLFSLTLRWLPASGFVSLSTDPIANLRLMVLPSLTVGLGLMALVLRQTRASLLNVLGEDYMRTATAKGLTPGAVVMRHGLRNALLPVVTVVGLQVGALLGGAVVTETVFSLPGLGRMLVSGIFSRDYPIIQGAVVVIVVAVLLTNLITDILYAILDPKAVLQ
ncbi:MAG: ABC transporter permease [Burkholderiales bacterium]|nr:ABC transporter permease [Burkholderiales bacterium]